jgi:hypothetical protein
LILLKRKAINPRKKRGINIIKTNYVYLFICVAFFVIFILSLFYELNPKVVIGYSLASFLFSLTDLLSTIYDNKSRYNDLKKDSYQQDIDDYLDNAKGQSQRTIESLMEGSEQINKAKNALLFQLINSSANVIEAQERGIIEPSKKIIKGIERVKSLEVFDMIASSIEDLKPKEKKPLYDYFNYILVMVAIVLIVSIPFVPDELIIYYIGPKYIEFGTYLTLLSLSIIFLTNSIRSHYNDKFQQLQQKTYYEMKSTIENTKTWAEFIEREMDSKRKDVGDNMLQLLELMKLSFKETVNRENGKE